MLKLNRLTKRYPDGLVALNQVSLELPSDEVVFLTGHSGAGKTTLLKLIAGLERATSGTIEFHGQAVERLTESQLPYHRRKIGMIFQNPQLLMDRNVFENVALPLIVSGGHDQELQRKVRAALDKVGLLQYEKKSPATLSGGEQQRLGIARAIVNKPQLLLADEPTGNLDPALSQEIMKLFLQLNQFGVSALIATHDLDLIQQLGMRNFVLNQGQLVDVIDPRPNEHLMAIPL